PVAPADGLDRTLRPRSRSWNTNTRPVEGMRSSSPLDLHRRHAHCGDDRADQEDRMCRLPAAATRITARLNTRTDRIPWTDQLLLRGKNLLRSISTPQRIVRSPKSGAA